MWREAACRGDFHRSLCDHSFAVESFRVEAVCQEKMNFLSRMLCVHETLKLSMGVQNKILTLCSSWQATRLQVNASAVGYVEDWS
jgi:hypothetical protein